MPSVATRLEQMRTAAERLRAAGVRIDAAVQGVHQMMDELIALGFESPAALEFGIRYRSRRTMMDDWGQVVQLFALRLDEAADEIEQALVLPQNAPPPGSVPAAPATPTFSQPLASFASQAMLTGMPAGVIHYPRYRRERPAAPRLPGAEEAPTSAVPAAPAYIAAHNRALHEAYQQQQAALTDERKHLEGLIRAREDKLDELAALKNRLMSETPTADLATQPRVIALKAEIAHIEGQILAGQAHIPQLEADLHTLGERLQRIAPGPGADLALIAQLEQGQTAQIIKDNTQDCVHYIANRMAIPPGLPSDAHLWDDNARRMAEYGITIGDQPLEGAVIVMEREHPYADPVYGHLLYVEKVEGGIAWVTDNKHATPVPLTSLTDELTGDRIKYLYFPWQTRA